MGNRDLIFGKRTSERPLGDMENSQVLPRRQSWWRPKGCSVPGASPEAKLQDMARGARTAATSFPAPYTSSAHQGAGRIAY